MSMKTRTTVLIAAILSLLSLGTALGNTYGSVEPIANPAVINTDPLRDQSLDVRAAFAQRLFQCGIVGDVVDALSSNGSITTIDGLNTGFQVGAGGFAGHTNPAFVYTVIDSGPNAASMGDIKILTDSLGYVLSQGSAFLLDADNPASFDFPANYVVLNFRTVPSFQQSAALFERVGRIDPQLFSTDTSGYTQYGRAYLSLQSDVSDARFIAGYVQAAREAGVEYTPIVNGSPALFRGGAAFPGNDWTRNRNGEEYLSRIPRQSHQALGRIRSFHLSFTQDALRAIRNDNGHGSSNQLIKRMQQLKCH